MPVIYPRNTSACAEKTVENVVVGVRQKKHLRLRGENLPPRLLRNEQPETPPLARRKLARVNRRVNIRGNTSACAEKTPTRANTS